MDKLDIDLILATVRVAMFCQRSLADHVALEIESFRVRIQQSLDHERERKQQGKWQQAAMYGRAASRQHQQLCRMLILQGQFDSWRHNSNK